jgi:hypothetical protein
MQAAQRTLPAHFEPAGSLDLSKNPAVQLGLTLVGGLLLLVIPAAVIPALMILVIGNAAGSIGDLAAVAWLLTLPPATLVRDSGDAITAYRPTRDMPDA